MKLETLKKYFKRSSRTKLYITTNEFLVSGYVCNPREEGDSLSVDIGPYVVYSFERGEVLHSMKDFTGLRLTPETKFTRRFKTHLGHIKNPDYVRDYLYQAREL